MWRMAKNPVATTVWSCLIEMGSSCVSGCCNLRRPKLVRAAHSCRYLTVWQLPTMVWYTCATDAEIGFRYSIRWETSKKTYSFHTRRETNTRQDPVTCRARGVRPSG